MQRRLVRKDPLLRKLLRCGDALCKKPVTAAREAAEPWTILCGSCGCALFPYDILEAPQPPDEFWLQRGELMRDVGGRLLPCHSSDVIRWMQERERDAPGGDPHSEELLGARGRPLLVPRDALRAALRVHHAARSGLARAGSSL